MTDPNVYPITAKFENEVKDLDIREDGGPFTTAEIADIAREFLGEYEHGTAEATDLWPQEVDRVVGRMFPIDRENKDDVTVGDLANRTVSAVLFDFIQFVMNHE